MFRAVYRSSSGALNVFAVFGLHTHVVTGRSQLRLDCGRSPHAYVNQRQQIQLELLMMSGIPLETCWAFNERWNNKLCYKVASCWLFLLNHATMHGSINIKSNNPLREKIIYIEWRSKQESGITWPLAGMWRLTGIWRYTDEGRHRLCLCAEGVKHNYWIAWKLEIGEWNFQNEKWLNMHK